MDPLANWDDLVSLKNDNAMPIPHDEELSYYFSECKDFGNLFDEALTTLQDLDVPSGYGQVQAPPAQRSPTGNSRSYLKHAKKPSGTAIFGFLDHNRELSLGGAAGDDMHRIMKPAAENVKSISPIQLARPSHMAISNEQLDYNFDEPLEACPPIHLNEEEEDAENQGNCINSELPGVKKVNEDMIVTNKNPKSYKFPPEPPTTTHAAMFDQFLGSARPMQPIHHPKREQTYPAEIDLLESPHIKRYVPIPVREPIADSMTASSPTYRQQQPQQQPQPQPQQQQQHQQSQSQQPQRSQQQGYSRMYSTEPLSMNMNVFLPPPSASSSSQASPEPHSPSPAQLLSSPLRPRTYNESSPLLEKRNNFYQPQFFSDDGEGYYPQPPSQFGSSPTRELPQSSPIRQMSRINDSHAADETIDANETILQLTPIKNHVPITPSTNRITLEWSPIISPNGKATKDVRRAIQELSPKRMMKKTSLLPPGELDKYWEGPDDDKNFICTYQNCGKKFTRRYNVRSHIQTHLSDRPFTCTYCPKSFVRQHDLNRHVKSHMVSKHCRCKCGREFTRIEGYKKHLANGVCQRPFEESCGAISKPGAHRNKGENILDGLTSNRLNEELNLDL